MYRIFIAAGFEKSVDSLTKKDQANVWKKIREYAEPQLKNEPHFGPNIKKLQSYHPETWRYRIGYYRLFYHIDEQKKVVAFLYLEHRKDAY